MELLTTLGRTLGFSFAAGINLYATVAILGLASRFHWVALPPQFAVFDNNWVIGIALVMYVVEFIADKVPWVDTLWDGLHTVIRPLGGAFVAVATLGEASPTVQGLDCAARRRGGGEHARDQGGDARRGQHQPRAVLELVPEPRRGRVRAGPRRARAEVPGGRAGRRDGAAGADRLVLRRSWCARAQPAGCGGRAAATSAAAFRQLPTLKVSVQRRERLPVGGDDPVLQRDLHGSERFERRRELDLEHATARVVGGRERRRRLRRRRRSRR